LSADSVTAARVVAVPLLAALRQVCPDYGRPPRGRPLWQGAAIAVAALLFLVASARGWL